MTRGKPIPTMRSVQRFQIRHDFDCTPEAYLAVIDSDEFHERLAARLNLKERRLLERRDDGDAVLVRWHVVPERDFPAPVRALVGGKGLSYVEEERQPRGSLVRHWVVRLDALDASRFRCEGTFELVPLGPARTRRDLDGSVDVRVFGVGGLVERIVAQGIRESYEKTTELVREMLAERRQAAP